MTDGVQHPTIAISSRVIDTEIGGNSTYVRHVVSGLREASIPVAEMRPRRNSAADWAFFEAISLQRRARRRHASVAWFPNDTGPVRSVPGLRTVLTLHGAAALHGVGPRGSAGTRLWLARAKAAARAADRVITDSASSARDIADLCGPGVAERTSVVPLGVDLDRFRPAPPDEIARVRDAYGIRDPYVFFVGNLEPRKNLVGLVAAIDTLNATDRPIRLLVAGRPLYAATETLAAIERSPHAQRLGWVPNDDLVPLLSGAAAFCFPSHYEGFGLPVLEALACGTPVVCSQRGSLPEVGGEAPFYSGTDPRTIAEALRAAVSADRAALRKRGVERARKFTWANTVERHIEILCGP